MNLEEDRKGVLKMIANHTLKGDFLLSNGLFDSYYVDAVSVILDVTARESLMRLITNIIGADITKIAGIATIPGSLLLAAFYSSFSNISPIIAYPRVHIPIPNPIEELTPRGEIVKENDHILILTDVVVAGAAILDIATRLFETYGAKSSAIAIVNRGAPLVKKLHGTPGLKEHRAIFEWDAISILVS